MKTVNYIAIFSIFTICVGCPDKDQITDSVITIKNNSNGSIIFYAINKPKNDTLLATLPYPITLTNADSVRPGTSTKFGGPFKELFEENPDEILMIYLFSRNIIENASWEKISDEYLVLRRYDFTLDSLEARRWSIEYP